MVRKLLPAARKLPEASLWEDIMKRKKKRMRTAAAALMLALSLLKASSVTAADGEDAESSGDYACTTGGISSVTLDDINIKIERQEEKEDYLVSPGETVPCHIGIRNIARPAWLRARIELENQEGLEGVDESLLELEKRHWIHRGDYYYYTRPVDTSATIDLMKNVRIPAEWSNDYSRRGFRLCITAEAVQKEHFTPDFDREDPWFGTLIEICVHDHYDEALRRPEQGNFSVEFRGGAEGLVRLEDEWNKNWQHLMPGDSAENTAVVENRYKKPVRLYFYTENLPDHKEELLKHVTLTIRKGDEVLSENTLDQEVAPLLGSRQE